MDYDVNSHLNMKLQITKTEIQKINVFVTNLFYEFLHPKETSEVEELPCG